MRLCDMDALINELEALASLYYDRPEHQRGIIDAIMIVCQMPELDEKRVDHEI